VPLSKLQLVVGEGGANFSRWGGKGLEGVQIFLGGAHRPRNSVYGMLNKCNIEYYYLTILGLFQCLWYRFDEISSITKQLKNHKKIKDMSKILTGITSNLCVTQDKSTKNQLLCSFINVL
jgi:hypothetical protein